MKEPDQHQDYVWHIRLSPDARVTSPSEPLTEMTRRQLRALLRCVVLTNNGADLRVTGFRLLDSLEQEHALFPEQAKPLGGDARQVPLRSRPTNGCETFVPEDLRIDGSRG